MKVGRRVPSEPPLRVPQPMNCASTKRGSRGPARPTFPNDHRFGCQKLRCAPFEVARIFLLASDRPSRFNRQGWS